MLGPAATPQLAATGADPAWERFLSHVVAALGHVRTLAGRDALSVEAHLWVRELTRIDRDADPTTRFRWGDDGPPAAGGGTEDVRPAFPALYCRRCGRSGWGVALAPVGTSLAVSDEGIRRDHAGREGRFRPLLYAGAAAEAVYAGQPTPPGLVWFSVRTRELLGKAPAEDDPDLRDGWVLPVLTSTGKDADDDARDDTCPACGQVDGIRFLGSAIATLLSVSLSTLFGSHRLDEREKKALVFTDSVQDAAHRAGFVQARSHTLTLRAVLRTAVQEGSLSLAGLVEEALRLAGNDPILRYRLLPPDCADRESFTPFWKSSTQRGAPQSVRTRVQRRLALDAALEFGLNARTGRTLELTGAVAVEVNAGEPARMAAAARTALGGTAHQLTTDGEHTDAVLTTWVRGVLDRMRAQGAIDHPWFKRYREEDGNRWWVTGGRNPQDGMPAFPGNRPGRPGRPAPGYPRVGGSGEPKKTDGLEPVTPAKSWYAQWTSKALDVSPHDGARLARLLLDALARDGVLTTLTSTSGATVYSIPADAVVVSPTTTEGLIEGRHLLVCGTCRDVVTGTPVVVEQLDGAPCMLVRCSGRLAPGALAPENFYRRLYASPDMRRVVAREHTSLLKDEVRLAYENGFKGSDTHPQSPNVLVATPTLEMGIDIGDLSAVFLSSLPRTVAAYLQRVGRAGRLTGNALNLAYLTGRGEQLPQARRPAVGHQRRGPAAGDLPAGRGDPAPPVHRAPDRRVRPRPAAPAPAEGVRGDRFGRAGQLPRRPDHPRRGAQRGPRRPVPRDVRGPAGDARRRAAGLVDARARAGHQRVRHPCAGGERALAADRRDAGAPADGDREVAARPGCQGRLARRHRRRRAGGAVGADRAQAHPGPARAPARRVLDRGPRGARAAAQLHPARRQRHPRRRAELDEPGHQGVQDRARPAAARVGAGDPRVRARQPLLRARPGDRHRRRRPRRGPRGDPAVGVLPGVRLRRRHRSRGRRAAPADLPAVRQHRHRRHRPAPRRRRADPRHRRDPPRRGGHLRPARPARQPQLRRRHRRRRRPGPDREPLVRRRHRVRRHLRPGDGPAVDQHRGPRARRRPHDRRRRALRRAVPRLQRLREARHRHRSQPPARAPPLVPVPHRDRREHHDRRAVADPAHPGPAAAAAELGDDRRRLRRPQPVRRRADGTARAARRAPRPHPRRAGRRPDAVRRLREPPGGPAARRRARRHRLPRRAGRPRTAVRAAGHRVGTRPRLPVPQRAPAGLPPLPAALRRPRAGATGLPGVSGTPPADAAGRRPRRHPGGLDDHRPAPGRRRRIPSGAAVPQGAGRAAADGRRHRHRGSRRPRQHRARHPARDSTGTGR